MQKAKTTPITITHSLSPPDETPMVFTRGQSGQTLSLSYSEGNDSDEGRATSRQPAKKKARANHTLNSWDSDSESELTDLDGDHLELPKLQKPHTVHTFKWCVKEPVAEFLATLPLDIIYYIFGQLEPLDLLRLARCTKTFRGYLMSKTSLSIWKSARENVPWGVPDCPSDQSEPQWANLIFTNDCVFCGQRGKIVDWTLRLRGCSLCINANLIYHLKAPILFPYVENIEDVLELLPYSNRNGSTSSRFYTCQEIVKMAATVEDGRNGMVVKRYEASKAQRKAEVASILQSGKKCPAWSLERSARKARQKADEELRVRVERERMITQKLKEAGHDDRDIDSIVYHPLVVKAVKITDARESLRLNLSSLVPNMDISFKPEEWVELSPKLTKLVMKEKERRLDRERRILVIERRKVFVTVIKDFQESNGLWECSFAPSLTEILATPPFWDVVEQTGDANITAEDFDGAIAAFPDWIEKWKTSKIMELLKIMANGGGPPLPNTPSNADFIVFNLAKTFFRCKRSIGIGKMHTLGNMDRHACIHRVHFPGAGDREITD
ncbi:hypothetical protein FRB94_010044 [Tulasnella sp. JGI-2019a]|nr:hypothetical protein FRB94_010044 [Tulasnella sp. JGI-2019a]